MSRRWPEQGAVDVAELADRVIDAQETLHAALRRILAIARMHQPCHPVGRPSVTACLVTRGAPHQPACRECSRPWPCPTHITAAKPVLEETP